MKGKPLTLKSVLTALNDVLRAVGLKDVEELKKNGKNALKGIPRAVEERIDYILSVAKLFAGLQGCKDFTEVGPIGFGDQTEDDEEEDDDDEEEEDE